MQEFESFSHHFNETSLKKLFFEKVFSSQAVGRDYITVDHFRNNMETDTGQSNEIKTILRKTLNGTYRPTSYKQLLISKEKGKLPRELAIPTVRDRLTFAALSKVLDDIYGKECITPQPQSVVSRVFGVLQGRQFPVCIKSDIKSFYGTIPHDQLMEEVEKRIHNKELQNLIREAIKTPTAPIGEPASGFRQRGVPEGLSISNRLANIYANSLDETFRGLKNAKFFRYVDDILIFCKEDAAEFCKYKLQCWVDVAGLELNKEKTETIQVGKGSVSYLGYTFNPSDPVDEITVRKSTVTRLERSLDTDLKRMKEERYLGGALRQFNNKITGCRITEDGINYERYGWLHYYSRINDVGLLSRLDALIKKLIKRYSLRLPGEVKKFRKAYYEMNYKADKTRYIPTYDFTCPVSVKRDDLKELFPQEDWDSYEEDEIDRMYSRRIRLMASRLERDIGLIS